jgi:hypothetical protein
MAYLKICLVGLGGAVLASLLWLIVAFFFPLYVPYIIRRIRGEGGVSEAYVGSGSVLIAAAIGFLVAAVWEWYRLRPR